MMQQGFLLILISFIALSLAQNDRFTADIVIDDPYISGNLHGMMYYNGPGDLIKIEFTDTQGGSLSISEISNYKPKSEDPKQGQTRIKLCPSDCVGFGEQKNIPRYYKEGSDTSLNPPAEFSMCSQCWKKSNPTSSGNVEFVCLDGSNTLCGAKHTDPAQLPGEGKRLWFTNVQTVSSFPGGTFAIPDGLSCFEGCDAPLDLCLVLDQSGSIDNGEWSALLSFVDQLVDAFKIGPDNVRIATSVYSCPHNTNNNDKYSTLIHGFLDDPSAIKSAINNHPKQGGCTCIKCGMEICRDIVQREARNLVPRVVVTLTDGRNNQPCPSKNGIAGTQGGYTKYKSCNCPGNPCYDEAFDFLKAESDSWQDVKHLAEMIAVAVGNNVATKELEVIAGGKPENVVEVSDFNSLPGIIDKLLEISCPVPNTNDCGFNCKGLCGCGDQCLCPPDCDDGDLCTADSCVQGQKSSGCTSIPRSPINDGSGNCIDPNDKCKIYGCDPVEGCTAVDRLPTCPDGPCATPGCDPRLGCILVPTQCTPQDCCHTSKCIDAQDQCVDTAKDPDDGNLCTIDFCDVAQCTKITDSPIVNNQIQCDDNDVCTDDVCVGGVCQFTRRDDCVCQIDVGGQKVSRDCRAELGITHPCQTVFCDETVLPNGECLQGPDVNCDNPDNLCNTYACQDDGNGNAECVSTTIPCEPQDLCHTAECIPATGECVQTPINCSSQITSACIASATCDVATGECNFTPKVCDDGDKCKVWDCDSVTGCFFEPFDCDAQMEDNDACTQATCDPAVGCGLNETVCPDNPCAERDCNPFTGECEDVRNLCLPASGCFIAACDPVVGICNDTFEKRADLKCDPEDIAAIAGGLAAGIIAVIVIACIVAAALAAAAAYKGYTALFQTGMSAGAATNNPLAVPASGQTNALAD